MIAILVKKPNQERKYFGVGIRCEVEVFEAITGNFSKCNKEQRTDPKWSERDKPLTIQQKNKLLSENNTLKLRAPIDNKLSLGNVFVDLYYKNDIEELKLFQGSKAILKEPVNQTNLIVNVKEGSYLEGSVMTEKTTILVATGGRVVLTGESSVVQIKATTGGVCSIEELASQQTNINASIGSVVHATSDVLMEAEASTGAIIRVYGSPEKIITKTMLGGRIKRIQ